MKTFGSYRPCCPLALALLLGSAVPAPIAGQGGAAQGRALPTIYEILDGFLSWMIAKFWRRIVRTHPEPAARPASAE